jgi:phage terminase large subunit
MDQVITIPYRPREHQLAIHDAVDSHRFAVAVCHRRFGKTVAAINQIIKAAVLCGRDNPRYAVVCPTYTQAKRVAWDYVTQYTRPLDPKVNISELRVDFMGRRISLYGADNPDSLRGIYLDGVVLDEVGDMNPKIWNEILRPALTDRGGWALFIGTPKGQNHFKELRDRAETEQDWALLEFKASETNILPKAELEAAKKEMGDDKYFQEFECSFSAAVEGSYYGTILNELAEERFKEIPRDDLCKTFAAGIWGWGTLRQYGLSKSRAKRSELWTTLRITVRA